MAPIHVALNTNNTFKISEKKKKPIILSKKVIKSLKKNKNSIISDLKIGNGEEKSYWQSDNVKIFTKKINLSCENTENPKLCIVKDNVTIFLDIISYSNLLLTALTLMRMERCPSFKADQFYILTRYKKIKLESQENTFSLFDEKNDANVTLPLAALDKLVQQKNKIFADLQGGTDFKRNSYWNDGKYVIYTKAHPCENFRMLCFGFSRVRIYIRDNTFQRLIDLLGEFFGEDESLDDDASDDETESYGEKIKINYVKSIQFSTCKRNCIITNKTDRVRDVKLPIAALETLLQNETKILADLKSDATPPPGLDYLSEYWSNGTYAIRTAKYNEKISLRFDGLRRNEYFFSMEAKSLSELLKIYKQEKSGK